MGEELAIPKKRDVWGQRLVSAIIGIVVAVTSTLVVTRLQNREPKLVFTRTESVPYFSQDGAIAAYHVSISNEGKVQVEGLNVSILVQGAKIDRKKISAPLSLKYSETLQSDILLLNIDDLNPGERVEVSLVATSAGQLPLQPEVSLRAKGVTGTEAPQSNTTSKDDLSAVTLTISAILAVVTSAISLYLLRSRRTKDTLGSVLDNSRGGDQRHNLAYVLRINGLHTLADDYLQRESRVMYWTEADRLCQMAIDSKESDFTDRIQTSLLNILDYPTEMSNTAKAIIQLNLARLFMTKGDINNAQKYLKEARAGFPSEVELRLKLDGILRAIPQ